MGNKRKRENTSAAREKDVDTSKPTATFKPTGGRKWTLSIAFPGSIIANAQSRELQAILAGQIARAVAVFCVDEVVVFDDGDFKPPPTQQAEPQGDHEHGKYTGYTDPNYFLAHILSYLECPPYLRRQLFPRHPDLQHTGMLPSLDMPHHLKAWEDCEFREGVTRENTSRPSKHEGQTLMDTGTKEDIYIPSDIPPNTRVTLRKSKKTWDAVAPTTPREEKGWYWGYTVRAAASLSAVMTECPFEGGYDLTFGTSERGKPVSEVGRAEDVPAFCHMMIIFGGVAGLEVAVKSDSELQKLKVKQPEALFDYWVNVVPGQGSRTIRCEEAIWLGLLALRETALSKGAN